MTLLLNLLLLLLALCSAADPTEMHQRQKRGARNYSRRACVDTDSAAVRDMGASWLRWKGPKVEFCRCAKQGRVRCHEIQVTTCLMSKCYNGGTCKKAVISSDFICQCPPGFTGTQCEINTGEHCVRGQGLGYRGNWSMSMSGLECVNWNSSSLRRKKFTARRPEANTLGLGNHNHCRNPDGDTKPWCYVYKKAQLSLEFCSVPTCITDPYLECVPRSGRPYRGTKSVTRRGLKCLPWDSPALSHKIYNAWRSDARKMGLGSHNFCRNPDNERGPWCHVYKGSNLTWELCGVPKCPRRMLGPRAHVTTNNQGSCGQRIEVPLNSLPTFRIRHGQVSDIREQPWQAAITVYQPRAQSYSFLCGGVLIDSCWILSAAHCFYETRSERFEEKRLRVVLGRTFRRQNSSSEQIFDVEKYWIHEQYKHDYNFDNDIALLKLKSEFGICAIHSSEVLPACLPDPNLVFPGWKECEISGYGKEEEFSSFISERIKRGMVRLWPQTRCVPEKLSGHQVTSNMLCAGDTRGLDDTCKGDSGGPLVCKKNGRMTLMGLTSWGDGCGKKDKPGVYTRVTNYLNWISSKTSAD